MKPPLFIRLIASVWAMLLFSACSAPFYETEPYFCWTFINTEMEGGQPERQFGFKIPVEEVKPNQLNRRHYPKDPRAAKQGYWLCEGPFPPIKPRKPIKAGT
jgi:hypothetical protein